MSAASIVEGSHPEMTNLPTSNFTSESFKYAVTHIFLPVQLPDKSDYTVEKDLSLARAVCAAARAYSTRVCGTSDVPQWPHVTKMLDNLQASVRSERLDRNCVVSQLRFMQTGDILAFLIRGHNSAIVLTKGENCTLFESFEVPPDRIAMEKAMGHLEYSYPESAIETPNEEFHDGDFQFELASFLCRPDGSSGDSHPQYMTALLSVVRQGAGHTANVPHIIKQLRDRAWGCGWRRSSLWLLVRVAIQTSLDRSSLGRASYKVFMLFFICTVARDVNVTTLSGDLLYLIGSKLLRRRSKLGPSVPGWLSRMVLETCAHLREILDAVWIPPRTDSSPFRNPSQDELRRDTQLSLSHSREHIRNALLNRDHESPHTPFQPSHPRRGTINDFLSSNGSFFDEVYGKDLGNACRDVELAVEQNIDDWLACVTNVDEACTQLDILMHKYMESFQYSTPEDGSIAMLTGMELFVALDKLAVKELPLLADYSPEIPTALLETLLHRRTKGLHRLSCAYQYLSARHSRSRPGWSVFSDEFTEESFPVRYYDQSPHHQRLKDRIEEAAGDSVSPLPALPLQAKVVVFELQCPACVRSWRSAVLQMLIVGDRPGRLEKGLILCPPVLEPYFIDRDGPRLDLQVSLAYFYPSESQYPNNPQLCYGIRGDSDHCGPESAGSDEFAAALWGGDLQAYESFREWDTAHLSDFLMNLWYTGSTSHTSNDVLSAQADCPTDFSLDEFIALGQLRSGGSLQWLNILRGLRSRTLDLRHLESYILLTSVLQVGPLDLDTGTWIWHQELDDPSFCDALLDELEHLFTDVGAGLMDAKMMSTISLLLTRVFASSPSRDISEKTVALLRNVRRKTFSWVQELSYNLANTFNVDCADLFHSAEDLGAALSCALFIYKLSREYSGWSIDENLFYKLLHEQEYHLSLSLEEVLMDAILSDASDYAIDLAVAMAFRSYKPSRTRWGQLQHSNDRWFTCRTRATVDCPSKTVYLNLLDGALRVDGQPFGEFLWGIPTHFSDLFCDQGSFVIPSDLPGMDFMTLDAMSDHRVHFSYRGHNIVARAQCNQSKDILELIPSSIFKEDLPPALIHGHIHWLNLSTGVIEIRPLGRLWEESPESWRIVCSSGEYHAYKGRARLVEIGSPTWTMVSQWFKCFDTSKRHLNSLLVTTSVIESTSVLQLLAELPHSGLSFFVNDREEFESHDFKDMVYDEDQCIGALYGLMDRLVFRYKYHLAEGLVPRLVLIPSDRHFKRDRAWVYGPTEPSFDIYKVDTELGCLITRGDRWGTQRLAYLHGITSRHKADMLTGKNGTQAAFFLLKSPRAQMIWTFDDTECWDSNYPLIYPLREEDFKKQYFVNQCYQYLYFEGLRYRSEDVCSQEQGKQDSDYTENDHLTMGAPVEHEQPSSQQCVSSIHPPWPITLEYLFSNRPAPELRLRSTLLRSSHKEFFDDIPELRDLFSSLPTDKYNHSFQGKYIARLSTSEHCIREDFRTVYRLMGENQIQVDALEKHYSRCKKDYSDSLEILKKSLSPSTDPHEQALDQFGQWPPIAADVLLGCLASTSQIKLPSQWKRCLVSFALLLLEVQRARRLFRFASNGQEEEFSKELGNEGCEGWNAEDRPDWLLIQIDGDFLIRRAQAEIAMEIISPGSGQNTVTQVNMGEGKSSVIIPIAAAALADGEQLVRVIVPKALAKQMFELLVARLGGLANRRIYCFPFSRSTKDTHKDIDTLRKSLSQCVARRGILLVRPKDVVSLKLACVENQLRDTMVAPSTLSTLQTPMYKRITGVKPNSLPEGGFVGNMFRWLSRSAINSKKRDCTRTGQHDIKDDEDACNTSDNASKWRGLQKWIDAHVRDILDESDEILHPRFQLIYTIGHEQDMDGYSDRWTTIQQILWIVKKHIHATIGYQRGPSGSSWFPHAPIDRASDIGVHLISWIVEDVMAGRLPGLSFQEIRPELRDAIRSFISDEDILQIPGTAKGVEEYAKRSHQSYMWGALLVLRGLLSAKILWFALVEKRWRIDYGLVSQSPHVADPSRSKSKSHTMLAVPYLAKNVPAPDTQFGQPEVTIILTCLSYYYGGLSEEQLRASFELLLDEDDPITEYALWVQGYSDGCLPESLRTLDGINLRSSEEWDKITFPLFYRNQATIDFYLSRVVFPQEMNEFPWKISVSGWDLTERREKLTTGFSGTNDTRWLLPLSITQHDLAEQQGTNARVLGYLLRPENNFYVTTRKNGEQETTHQFLENVAMQRPEIRVLLDVGAQILDLSNREVAKAWLDVVRDASGAIYFDENDELMILTRNGVTTSMLSSPLSHHLDLCVVYLDHAHTRGTDLKLPLRSRAAVTLGLKLTKDRLVQGCMRMRKLGRGHSVMFFAPPEVDLSIRTLAGKKDKNATVYAIDILRWAIHETLVDVRQRAPYWAQQGIRHKVKRDTWSRFCRNELSAEQLSATWLEPDCKSLEDLYAPCEAKSTLSDMLALDSGIHQRCKDLGILSLPNVQMEAEQEREVNREREREREVEKLPPKAKAAEHFLHPDVVAFVKSGVIPPFHSQAGSAFRPVFTTLQKSSAATRDADVWSPFILATTDFCNTIIPDSTQGTMDQYLRPVQWVLSSRKDQVLVLLSPFETNCLMPDIRTSENVHLHLYAPRTSRRMQPSDDLKLYSIPALPSDWTPPWALIDQLNVFAGQLYLRDYNAYSRLCHFLGVPTGEQTDSTLAAVRWNKFNIPGSFEEDDIRFSGSPLPCVMALLSIRNRGRPFGHTHMGKIHQGQPLKEKDFDMPRSVVSCHITSAHKKAAPCDFASETISSGSSLDKKCDSSDGLRPSTSLSSSKRSLEMAEISRAEPESPRKRPRSG